MLADGPRQIEPPRQRVAHARVAGGSRPSDNPPPRMAEPRALAHGRTRHEPGHENPNKPGHKKPPRTGWCAGVWVAGAAGFEPANTRIKTWRLKPLVDAPRDLCQPSGRTRGRLYRARASGLSTISRPAQLPHEQGRNERKNGPPAGISLRTATSVSWTVRGHLHRILRDVKLQAACDQVGR